MVRRKKKQVHHTYTDIHKLQVFEWRAKGRSYTEIQRSFEERFGWKIGKGKLSEMLSDKTEPTEPQAKSKQLAKTEQQTELIEKRIADTIKTREQALGMLARYVDEIDKNVDKNGLEILSLKDKYFQLRQFITTLLGACESLDRAKNLMPEITAGTVNIQQFNFNQLDDEQLRKLYPMFKAEFCSKCPYYKSKDKIIDMPIKE